MRFSRREKQGNLFLSSRVETELPSHTSHAAFQCARRSVRPWSVSSPRKGARALAVITRFPAARGRHTSASCVRASACRAGGSHAKDRVLSLSETFSRFEPSRPPTSCSFTRRLILPRVKRSPDFLEPQIFHGSGENSKSMTRLPSASRPHRFLRSVCCGATSWDLGPRSPPCGIPRRGCSRLTFGCGFQSRQVERPPGKGPHVRRVDNINNNGQTFGGLALH